VITQSSVYRIRSGARISSAIAAGIILLTLTAGCQTKPDSSAEEPPESSTSGEEWISLFNGVDIEDWEVKIAGYEPGVNYANTFQVEHGSIIVNYSEYGAFDERFGVLVYPKPYSYYKLAVEYRFTGEQLSDGPGWAFRNSGVMIHSQSAASMLRDQDFPISIEVQLLGGNGEEERSTANLCTPGTNVVMDGELVTRHCINSVSKTYHGDGWVRVEIEVLGADKITHRIDGTTVLEYRQPQIGGGSVSGHDSTLVADGLKLSGGYISLQSESHPVEFRVVELLNLRGCMNQESVRYRSYYVVSDPVAC